MKHLVLALALSFSFLGHAFAEEGKIDKNVLESFNSAFKNATDVNWVVTDHYYKANFQLNGQYISAFYNADGRMIAATRNVSLYQLPLSLQLSIRKDYADFWISDLFELNNEDGISYFITLENAGTRTVLRSGSDGSWSLYRKSMK